jgi:hypothetical protein
MEFTIEFTIEQMKRLKTFDDQIRSMGRVSDPGYYKYLRETFSAYYRSRPLVEYMAAHHERYETDN